MAQHIGSASRSRRRSRGRSPAPAAPADTDASASGAPSPGSSDAPRGRSRVRRPDNPLADDALRQRGYHALLTPFGKVFHVEKRWKLIREMGSGAYGVVISAADEISGETVAIKQVTRVLDKLPLAKRALREITLLRHFANHENITGLIDLDAIGPDFNEIYIFLEPMEADLHQIIRSGQMLTTEHVQYFLYQILRGMKYIHSAGVVHRDLKPGNLLVNADCELKICDFGLSRGFDQRPDGRGTQMTEYVATRWYRAPEIMLAFRRYDTAIDVWSIGCIFAELMTGKTLFKGKDYIDQLNKILEGLGTPDESVITRIGSDKAQAYVRSLPYSKGVPLKKVIPMAGAEALDLVAQMLAFDPAQRTTVVGALAHPWLSAYHDAHDEPACAAPFERWRALEELETLDDYRAALWAEIQDFRRQARSVSAPGTAAHSPEATRTRPPGADGLGEIAEGQEAEEAMLEPEPEPKLEPEPEPEPTVEPAAAQEEPPTQEEPPAPETQPATSETLVEPVPEVAAAAEKAKDVPDDAPIAFPGAEPLADGSAEGPVDPVVSYARRSSLMRAGSYSMYLPSRPRGAHARIPSFADVPALAAAAAASGTLSDARALAAGAPAGIPFPSADGGSYVVPSRTRAMSHALMPGAGAGDGGDGGGRKLLRTLSTLSIHESGVGLPGGLAALAPIGRVLREQPEADFPFSDMPEEFAPHWAKDGPKSPSRRGGRKGAAFHFAE